MITGGASGIGLEAAKQFLSHGLKVIITGREQEKLNEIKKLYPGLITIKSDLTSAEDAKSLLNQVKECGGIDILYNNAGVMSRPANLGITNDSHFANATNEINTNYLGVIRLNNLFIDMLNSREEAAIINTTSILSYVPFILAPTYAASKVALRFYTESLRSHLLIIGSKIKIFELLPPVVATRMADNLDTQTITPTRLVQALIGGLTKDRYTIRVGNTKLVYLLSRLSPKLVFNILNSKKNARLLQK